VIAVDLFGTGVQRRVAGKTQGIASTRIAECESLLLLLRRDSSISTGLARLQVGCICTPLVLPTSP